MVYRRRGCGYRQSSLVSACWCACGWASGSVAFLVRESGYRQAAVHVDGEGVWRVCESQEAQWAKTAARAEEGLGRQLIVWFAPSYCAGVAKGRTSFLTLAIQSAQGDEGRSQEELVASGIASYARLRSRSLHTHTANF